VRIKAITLCWFRGAANPISLTPDCKSMVVYGLNGSGKSSFVDAIEYLLNEGKIGHLAHEYSGKHLKNSVPNTHKPLGAKTEVSLKLCDGAEAKAEIRDDGSPKTAGLIKGWDYRRTVLRQDEVAAFIKETKGGKYSALLPLLGLHPLEIAADNLRHLAKNIESLAQIEQRKASLAEIDAKRKQAFGDATDEQIAEKVGELHGKYCPTNTIAIDTSSRCAELTSALETKIASLSADQKRHLALRTAADVKLKAHVDDVRIANSALAGAVDPLIAQKIAVLQPTGLLMAKLPTEGDVTCPSCGQSIAVNDLREHVTAELERLRAVRETFNARNVAIALLSDSVKSLRASTCRPEVKAWRDRLVTEKLPDNFAHLDDLDAEALRGSCEESDLDRIERKLVPIVELALEEASDSPPEIEELLKNNDLVEVAKSVGPGTKLASDLAQANLLLSSVKSLEASTRNEIRTRANEVIGTISGDIKTMWSILHPGEAIEDVHLYIPPGVDKAIDIGLKFHGKEQDSPRLTLSEGYRNSLGLCIFLAMAKREAGTDRPVVLDDVVVSLDRNHRGMIVELLEKEFSQRQVIVLTHDREWYMELRQQLDGSYWSFKALLPYETPQIGIQWSHKTTTFDDARAQLKDRPDSAGNDARKIMDLELSLIAERLQIRLPYLRFEKNDRRLAHDFLERLIATGNKCFQRVAGKDSTIYKEGIETIQRADKLLISWGNRASHSFDVVHPEATKLIDECEKALACFKCTSCGKPVWFAEVSGSEWVQCQCGALRWRYGKE
jgi:energy-coupling factor transporter ATP-binding protein EcfA2